MAGKISLTRAGKEKLEKELSKLKGTKRPQVIERIKRAKEYGDLSENAEYEDARNEQSFIEGRIQEIEHILKYADLVKDGNADGRIALGSKVSVKLNGEAASYEVVGSAEANPAEGKISSESPIGAVLMGKKIGGEAVAQTPGGEVKLKILKVE